MRIDAWSDLVCPWCWIGKRRLARALQRLGTTARKVGLRWHPVPARSRRRQRSGAAARGLCKQVRRSRACAADARQHPGHCACGGTPLRFRPRAVRVTTLPAHRLLWLTAREGDAGRVGEALFDAHFAEGRNLADRAMLVEAGHAGGLPEARVRTLLSGDEGESGVRVAIAQAQAMGARSVPTFVIDGLRGAGRAVSRAAGAGAAARGRGRGARQWRWGLRPGRLPRLNRWGRRWAAPRDLLRQCAGARPRT